LTSLDLGDGVKLLKEAATVYRRSVDNIMEWYYFENNPFQYFSILTSKLRNLCTKIVIVQKIC
jgi:hypothetical protein